jgi:hypothetical protein
MPSRQPLSVTNFCGGPFSLKASSVSTPVLMVVYPSATGLNIALAKGVNMLPLIPDILIRLRTYLLGRVQQAPVQH